MSDGHFFKLSTSGFKGIKLDAVWSLISIISESDRMNTPDAIDEFEVAIPSTVERPNAKWLSSSGGGQIAHKSPEYGA